MQTTQILIKILNKFLQQKIFIKVMLLSRVCYHGNIIRKIQNLGCFSNKIHFRQQQRSKIKLQHTMFIDS